jgi:hypothetical protein
VLASETKSEVTPIDRKLVLRWARATWFGWLLGIPIIAVSGLILGLVTGVCLGWMVQQERAV